MNYSRLLGENCSKNISLIITRLVAILHTKTRKIGRIGNVFGFSVLNWQLRVCLMVLGGQVVQLYLSFTVHQCIISMFVKYLPTVKFSQLNFFLWCVHLMYWTLNVFLHNIFKLKPFNNFYAIMMSVQQDVSL